MSFLQGNSVDFDLSVRIGADLVDPVSVSLLVVDPTGARETMAPTRIGLGVYRCSMPLSVVGRWVYRWTTIGNGADGVVESWCVIRSSET